MESNGLQQKLLEVFSPIALVGLFSLGLLNSFKNNIFDPGVELYARRKIFKDDTVAAGDGVQDELEQQFDIRAFMIAFAKWVIIMILVAGLYLAFRKYAKGGKASQFGNSLLGNLQHLPSQTLSRTSSDRLVKAAQYGRTLYRTTQGLKRATSYAERIATSPWMKSIF